MAIDTNIDPAEAWELVRKTSKNLKTLLTGYHADLLAGDITLENVFNMYRRMEAHQTQLNELAVVPNLNDYVQSVLNNPGYNAVAEIGALNAEIDTALLWIDTNASGLNLTGDSASNWGLSGSTVTNRFSAAQTADLRTAMVAIGALITV